MSLDPLENRVTAGAHGDVIARAVLVILRTVSGNHVNGTPRPWRIANSAGALSDGDLIQVLTAMPKPVVCEVIRSEGGPEIKCGRPDENQRWKWWAEAYQEESVFSPPLQEEMDRTGNRRVLLAGETESIVLSDDEVKQLSRDYVIIGAHTVCSFVTSRLGAPKDVAILTRYWAASPSTSIIEIEE